MFCIGCGHPPHKASECVIQGCHCICHQDWLPRLTAQRVAEMVVRPVLAGDEEQEAVGLYVGNECKFVIPVEFVLGQSKHGLQHLLKNIRMVIEEAVQLGVQNGS